MSKTKPYTMEELKQAMMQWEFAGNELAKMKKEVDRFQKQLDVCLKTEAELHLKLKEKDAKVREIIKDLHE